MLAAATFLIFFQAFMVAPLIPRLGDVFGVEARTVGFAVPAYMLPYGIATLVFGLLSDHLGRRRLLLLSWGAFVALTLATATATTLSQLLAWRIVTGFGAGGVVPLALALIGDTYAFERRGRPLGLLFAAMAGGMAFGSTLGVLAEPLLGWRGLFIAVAVMSAVVFLVLVPYRNQLGEPPATSHATVRDMLHGFHVLLSARRGRRTYAYVLANSTFHSGVFTWLGFYFSRRYGLGDVGIAIAIIGYGLPGFVLGPRIGRAADRHGRRWLLPAGLAIGAAGALALIPPWGIGTATVAVLILSLGYDLTQPLLAGIVTSLGGRARSGQAMGLNVFILFSGFALGSLVFGQLLTLGLNDALAIFGLSELTLAAAGIALFRGETPTHAPQLSSRLPSGDTRRS